MVFCDLLYCLLIEENLLASSSILIPASSSSSPTLLPHLSHPLPPSPPLPSSLSQFTSTHLAPGQSLPILPSQTSPSPFTSIDHDPHDLHSQQATRNGAPFASIPSSSFQPTPSLTHSPSPNQLSSSPSHRPTSESTTLSPTVVPPPSLNVDTNPVSSPNPSPSPAKINANPSPPSSPNPGTPFQDLTSRQNELTNRPKDLPPSSTSRSDQDDLTNRPLSALPPLSQSQGITHPPLISGTLIPPPKVHSPQSSHSHFSQRLERETIDQSIDSDPKILGQLVENSPSKSPLFSQTLKGELSHEDVLKSLSEETSLSAVSPASFPSSEPTQKSPVMLFESLVSQEPLDLSAEKHLHELQNQLDHVTDLNDKQDLLLEMAQYARDELFDLEQASVFFWQILEHAPLAHKALVDAVDGLNEIYIAGEEWEQILKLYQTQIQRGMKRTSFLHLQSASTLKTLGRWEEALESIIVAGSEKGALELHVEILKRLDRIDEAVDVLMEDLENLSDQESVYRQYLAAHTLKESQPSVAAELFEQVYHANPNPKYLNEWMDHSLEWGDPYGRASAVRAYVQSLGTDDGTLKKRSKALGHLAREVAEQAPLLSIDLLQNVLTLDLGDVESAELLIEIALKRDQYRALRGGLSALISQCLEGEYRGLLKLRLIFTLFILTEIEEAQKCLDSLLEDFQDPLQDSELFDEILDWGQQRCSSSHYQRVTKPLKLSDLI